MTSSELAVGVVGLGFGANHARVLSEMSGVHLAAICDPDVSRLAAVSRGRTLHAYTDFGEMLQKESLDAVVIAVPAQLHVELGMAAIGAGCALFVEKPLGTSLSEGRQLTQAAATAGVPLFAGHLERFNPALQELSCRLQAGEIGRPLQLSARRMAPIVRRASQVVNIVHDSALHDVYVMRWLLGSEVEQVSALAQAGIVMPFEDSLLATLRFESGAIGSLDVNWLSSQRIRDLTVLGETGTLVASYADFRSPTLMLHRNDGVENIAIEPREPLEQELSAFVAAVRDGSPMPVTAQDALAALAVADALTESARTGLPVRPIQP